MVIDTYVVLFFSPFLLCVTIYSVWKKLQIETRRYWELVHEEDLK